uniref:NADH dehydrogenase subunit 6 n=1 Tax=Caliscelis rhabdocladis TaxID=3081100 RepID=UPI002E789EB1|nr:NADH dehydrogenase subunit 6 [Caliscelis rhabdocladis]WQB38579.1 NADH dehydrogenase subunit 6 [Caliscelis rhabdocladis]
MLLKLIMLFSMITPFLKHPISMGSMLMMQTMMICLVSSSKFNSPWYSYILFITMIGGLMVMFMYMSSIASNEKMKMMPTKKIIILLTILMIIFIMNMKEQEYMEKMYQIKLNTNNLEEIKSTSKFFNFKKMNLSIMMIMILLFTMVSITNISSSKEGPLKMK